MPIETVAEFVRAAMKSVEAGERVPVNPGAVPRGGRPAAPAAAAEPEAEADVPGGRPGADHAGPARRRTVAKHFAAKAVFALWDPRVLADYVASGFEERDGATHLAFRREVETRIYETLPHHLGGLLHRHPPRCPVAFLAGRQSVEVRQGGLAASKALAQDRFAWMDGGHLFPMEQPEHTAAEVLRWISGMDAPTPSI